MIGTQDRQCRKNISKNHHEDLSNHSFYTKLFLIIIQLINRKKLRFMLARIRKEFVLFYFFRESQKKRAREDVGILLVFMRDSTGGLHIQETQTADTVNG